jgi:hypothetical protein
VGEQGFFTVCAYLADGVRNGLAGMFLLRQSLGLADAPAHVLTDMHGLDFIERGRVVAAEKAQQKGQFAFVVLLGARRFAGQNVFAIRCHGADECGPLKCWSLFGMAGEFRPFGYRRGIVGTKRNFLARLAAGVQVIEDLLPTGACPHSYGQVYPS